MTCLYEEDYVRHIDSHKVNPVNEQIEIQVLDEPGHGAASHDYLVRVPLKNGEYNVPICFQNGPIAEVGVNGITHEVLLAILIDRLEAFQDGPYACHENELALTKIKEAKEWLFSRTRERMQRGVEGTHLK